MLRDNVAPKTVYVWLIYSVWIDNEFVMAYLEHRKEPELGTDLPSSLHNARTKPDTLLS